MVLLLLALSQVTWPTFAVEDKHGRTSMTLLCLPYAQFPLTWRSWIRPGQAVHHYVRCWAMWNRWEHFWVPSFWVLTLRWVWSSVLWPQKNHRYCSPAMHHMLSWLRLERLNSMKWWEKNKKQRNTYIKLGLQCRKVILEHAHGFCPGCLPAWNVDAICCMRSNVNQLLELRVLKGLDWL